MNALDLIASQLAAAKTHACVTTYASGARHTVETTSAAAAESVAKGERRKIGRDLIGANGRKVRVVAGDVVTL